MRFIKEANKYLAKREKAFKEFDKGKISKEELDKIINEGVNFRY